MVEDLALYFFSASAGQYITAAIPLFSKALSLLIHKLFNLLSEQCMQHVTSLDVKMYAFPMFEYHWAESLQFEKTPHPERHWSFSLCVQKCQN